MSVIEVLNLESCTMTYYPSNDITTLDNEIRSQCGLESMLMVYVCQAFQARLISPLRAVRLVLRAWRKCRKEESEDCV